MTLAATLLVVGAAMLIGGAVALAGVWIGARLSPASQVAPPARAAGGTLVDTSALIDGRIAEIAAAGFLEPPIVVPAFVLRELQRVADAGDSLRRARGRRGFEVLGRLRQMPGFGVEVDETDVPEAADVDDKLVRLARSRAARVVTTDYNLNRVAGVYGLRVLNVNDLAAAVRRAVIAGELLSLAVVREGKEPGQGVGFLDDGTMVVVDQGKRWIGQAVDVVVTSMLQTTAGRLVFARLRDEIGRDA